MHILKWTQDFRLQNMLIQVSIPYINLMIYFAIT
jgi:hypothetical protein